MPGQSIDGAILAGGRSRRMGGAPKALLDLAGRTMLERVLRRFAPQVGQVVLSVERPSPEWARFGLAQVGDPVPGFHGPLAGLFAALEAVRGDADWLVSSDGSFDIQHVTSFELDFQYETPGINVSIDGLKFVP